MTSKKLLTVAKAVAILAIFIILAGVLMAMNQNDRSANINDLSGDETATTTSILQSGDELSDWNKYENKELGFSFKYPKDWKQGTTQANETGPHETSLYLDSPENQENDRLIKSGEMYGEGFQRSIYIFVDGPTYDFLPTQPGDLPDNLRDYLENDIAMEDVQSISFAGQPAYSATEGGMGAYYTIFVEKGGKIYQIRFGNRESVSELSSIENQILDSFQFTK